MSFVLYNRDGKTFADKHIPAIKGLFAKKEPFVGGKMRTGDIIFQSSRHNNYVGRPILHGILSFEGDASKLAGHMIRNSAITFNMDDAHSLGGKMVGGTIRFDGDVGSKPHRLTLYNREGKTWVDRHLPNFKNLFVKKEPFVGGEMRTGDINWEEIRGGPARPIETPIGVTMKGGPARPIETPIGVTMKGGLPEPLEFPLGYSSAKTDKGKTDRRG